MVQQSYIKYVNPTFHFSCKGQIPSLTILFQRPIEYFLDKGHYCIWAALIVLSVYADYLIWIQK